MSFLNPTLLALGLSCIAIPIAIHILMRRRRKPVPWAAMRFLLEAYRQQRRRTRFEQLLLLAARCLLVAALAVALGRPALTAAGFLARMQLPLRAGAKWAGPLSQLGSRMEAPQRGHWSRPPGRSRCHCP